MNKHGKTVQKLNSNSWLSRTARPKLTMTQVQTMWAAAQLQYDVSKLMPILKTHFSKVLYKLTLHKQPVFNTKWVYIDMRIRKIESKCPILRVS